MDRTSITIVGGGLAGSEAAFQLAVRGVPTTLFEMRPVVKGPAHHTSMLAELVCSNSLKSADPATAPGMLKTELSALGSLVLAAARASAVPAGGALAVDRDRFSGLVTEALQALPALTVVREEVRELPAGPVILATGPLTSPGLEPALSSLLGEGRLGFYDAAAPIVSGESLDRDLCFNASRYGKGGSEDYVNCPMDRPEYELFADALISGERVTLRDFESRDLFQACQPVEEIARKGRDAPRYGAMKPVGLTDPRTGRRPWAVVQLRPEDREGRAYNLVGFQTNLTFAEQRRVFRMIPGLGAAEFLRYGVMHRNTFVDAPHLLMHDLALREHPDVRIAGQLAGTEGYLEAAAGGLIAAIGAYAASRDLPPVILPPTTAFGALLAYATDPATEPYQPMHVNFGLLPELAERVRDKRERHSALARLGAEAIDSFVSQCPDLHIDAALGSLAGAGL